MAEDVQPLLAEVRDSGLLKEVESLTKSLTEITTDLRYGFVSTDPNFSWDLHQYHDCSSPFLYLFWIILLLACLNPCTGP